MEKIRPIINDLLKAVLAGACVSLGGSASLVTKPIDPVAAAFLFTLGLFATLIFDLNLYTGKIGYLVYEKPKHAAFLALVLFGNFVGTVIMGLLMSVAFDGVSIAALAVETAEIKLEIPLLQVFVRAIFCGVLMFIAADGYKRMESPLLKAIPVVLGVMVFSICGFEHSIADAFYFAASGSYSLEAFVWIMVAAAGNSVGSILLAGALKAVKK